MKEVYNLENLYVGSVNNIVIPFYLEENGLRYKALVRENEYYSESDINNLDSLYNYLKTNELVALLYGQDGKIKNNLKMKETYSLIQIVRNKKEMQLCYSKKIKEISEHSSNAVCDYLGFNPNYPRTNIDVGFRNPIIVTASQLKTFTSELSKFIFANLIANKAITIKNEDKNVDYITMHSLDKAGIKLSLELIDNQFCLEVTRRGIIKIENNSLEEKFEGKREIKVIEDTSLEGNLDRKFEGKQKVHKF